MSELANLLLSSLAGGSLLALSLALVGGVLASLNPCCVALYPAAAATCCATGERLAPAFWTAAAFAVGVGLATSLLGVLAAPAGTTMVGLGVQS